jgi:hypothetical protein
MVLINSPKQRIDLDVLGAIVLSNADRNQPD